MPNLVLVIISAGLGGLSAAVQARYFLWSQNAVKSFGRHLEDMRNLLRLAIAIMAATSIALLLTMTNRRDFNSIYYCAIPFALSWTAIFGWYGRRNR